MKVYIAGPDVFREDAYSYFRDIKDVNYTELREVEREAVMDVASPVV